MTNTRTNGIWRTSLKAGGGLSLVAGFLALALVGCPSGGVGDECTPEDEYKENFAGFKISEENIESRSFQCQSRICLVNHFQGRVSCPHGQAPPKNCSNGEACTGEETCTPAGVLLTDCDPTPCGAKGANPANCNNESGLNAACGNRTCDKAGFCHCDAADCPEGYYCDNESKLCSIKVCSVPNDDKNRCYVPGTEIPIATEVCAQCAASSKRDALNAVYCSCRCGPPSEGATDADDNFNFCECPENYVCQEIRKNVGLGDAQIAGKYCVKQGTQYTGKENCGKVQGHWGGQCSGTGG